MGVAFTVGCNKIEFGYVRPDASAKSEIAV
jgi:hypothetical protein